MHNKHHLAEQVARSISNLELNTSICIGLSGGVDSVVLLHILKHLELPIKLFAIHVNHGISANAQVWSDFCQGFCDALMIDLQIKNITLNRSGGESLENVARQARHSILLQSEANIIALAHHQNDQVETLLSQLFRGSDLHNIAAMHEISTKQNKTLWRPLLNITRLQIEEYAKFFELEYINDESNLDTKYLRNFIRHDILPPLIKWDENITTKILNFSGQLQNILALSDEIALNDLAACSTDKQVISVKLLQNLTKYRQLNVLNQFIKSHQLALPGSRQLQEFTKQATTSSWDSKPQLKLNTNACIIKYKDNIYIEGR